MAMSNVPPAPGRQALHEEQRSTPTVLWHGFPENVVMTVLQHLVLQASHCRLFVLQPPQVSKEQSVVVTGPFINFLLHNHFITENFFKKKSGDVNDEANFSLFILLHKRAKPILSFTSPDFFFKFFLL